MRPAAFLELAEALASINHPAYARSAVSRAYYASFHQAADVQEADGFAIPGRPGDHQLVADRFRNSGDVTLKLLGSALLALHDYRKKADYELGEPEHETQKNALARVTDAKNLVAALEKLSKTGIPPAAVAYISKWALATGRP